MNMFVPGADYVPISFSILASINSMNFVRFAIPIVSIKVGSFFFFHFVSRSCAILIAICHCKRSFIFPSEV